MSECLENIPGKAELGIAPIKQFTFPEDARWNAERRAVEVGVEIGEYQVVARVPRHVFQCLFSERPTPERAARSSPLTAHPLGAHCRAQAPPAPVDGRWQRRVQRGDVPEHIGLQHRLFER